VLRRSLEAVARWHLHRLRGGRSRRRNLRAEIERRKVCNGRDRVADLPVRHNLRSGRKQDSHSQKKGLMPVARTEIFMLSLFGFSVSSSLSFQLHTPFCWKRTR